MKAEQIQYIENDVEYVLMRPNLYIGSTSNNATRSFILRNDRFIDSYFEYVPAFLKLFDEVISNSVDEATKTNFKFANKIEVTFDVHSRISITDNGRGISSEIEPNTKLPQAVVALTKLKAGSNFNKESTSIGQNGVGASLVNIFSKEFCCETSDGEKKTTINCYDNLSKMSYNQRKNSSQFTKISFLPDYERLAIDITDTKVKATYHDLIYKRVLNMAMCYEQITFTFNGQRVKNYSIKEYAKMHDDRFDAAEQTPIFNISGANVDVAILPFQNNSATISFVNGIETYRHGQHLSVFIDLFKKAIKDSSNRKLNGLSAEDVLKNCTIFISVKNVINPSFSAQIKDELTNSYSDIKKYFADAEIDKLLASMMRNQMFKDVIDIMSESVNKINERKAVEKDEKKLKKHKVTKYIEPISNKTEFCNFYLCEGDSAIAQLINVRNNFTAGYPLKGKAIPNPRTASPQKMIANETVKDLLYILGLKLSSDSIEDFKFRSIYFLTDQDNDGDCIAAQLLNLFYTFWPDLIRQGKIYRVLSPLIIAKRKTTKEKETFYSLQEFIKNQDDYDIIEYNKGLGSLSKEEYAKLVNNPVLIQFSESDCTEEKLDLIFGKSNQDKRKLWLNSDEENEE